MLCFVLLGALRFQVSESHQSIFDEIFAGQSRIFQPVEFEVRSVLSSSAHSYEIMLWSLSQKPIQEKLLLYSQKKLKPGSAYESIAEILPIIPDPVLDTYLRKYPAKAYIGSYAKELVSESRNAPKRNLLSFWTLRAKGINALDNKLGEHSSLAKALIFSDTAEKTEWNAKLSRSGLVHLVVVSGLHVWFLYLVVMVFLNVFLPRRLAESLFIVFSIGFATLNNWAPPITRAISMIALFILSRWYSRPVSKAQILALSLFLVTAVDPTQLFSIGLQLSYASVAIIFFAVPTVHIFGNKATELTVSQHFINRQVNHLLLSLLVGIGILPITLWYFGKASLNGVIGNIPAIPLIMLMIPVSLLVLLLPSGSAVYQVFHAVYTWFYYLFEGWTQRVSSLPFFVENFQLGIVELLGVTVLVISFLLLVMGQRRKLKYALFTALFLFPIILLYPHLSTKPNMELIVFNADVADCTFIRLEDESTILIDTGMAYNRQHAKAEQFSVSDIDLENSWLQRKLLKWFKTHNVKRVDYLILTHMHNDHYGGIPALFQNFPVRNIIVSDETQSNSLWQIWEEKGLFASSQIHTITDTISFHISDVRLKFLHPDKAYSSIAENNRSLVFRLDRGGKRYLFTGDMEAPAEEYLLAKYPEELKADYLKVSHHGSKSASTEDFIRNTQAREAWISSSQRNRYGFPHREVMDRLGKYNVKIQITSGGSIRHTQKKD